MQKSVSQLYPFFCKAGFSAHSCHSPSGGDARREERWDEDVLGTMDGLEVPGTLSRRAGAASPGRPAERRLVGGGSAAAQVAAMYGRGRGVR